MELKIIAKVRFNQGFAYVLNKDIHSELVYKKRGNIMYGTNDLFYSCYKYDRPSGRFYAFAGRKFDIKLEDGTTEHCYGQWWYGGTKEVSELENIELSSVTFSTIDKLKKCYVFSGYEVNQAKMQILIDDYNKNIGYYYDYYDYEKVIKYDDERSRLWTKQTYLEGRISALIKEVKKLSKKQ